MQLTEERKQKEQERLEKALSRAEEKDKRAIERALNKSKGRDKDDDGGKPPTKDEDKGKPPPKPESTEGGRRVSVLKRQEGAPVNLG